MFRSLVALLILAVCASAQPPPTQKSVPPTGKKIEASDFADLTEAATALSLQIESLRTKASTANLLPDIMVFHKAVDWALRYDEFMDVKHVAIARELLAEGRRRAEALADGRTPWLSQTGLVVRGYRSRIDDSVQPYGLVVPADWSPAQARPRRLDIWHHGRAETMTELAFIHERMKKPGEFMPDGAFVLHPYGRFCNATKFAGEMDNFEALAHVHANYPIDAQRIVLRGFSMGGASSWHLAVHHPGDWCAVNPGAGFVETARYADVFKAGKPSVPWWEQVLWRWYDADIAAANLYNVPVVAYSGERDKQKAAADTMVAAASVEGIEIPHVIGPDTEHKYEPAARKFVAEKIDALAEKGSVAVPSKIRFVTHGLRYHRIKWLELDALDRHWERAKVDAEIVDEGTIRIATQNVAALTLRLKSDPLPLDKTQPPRVIIDGDHLVGPAVTAPWIASFHREANGWKPGPTTPTGLRKQHGLSGPIDDAFMDRFIFVRPSNPGFHASTDQWVSSELTRATTEWRRVFRGEALVKDDRNISEQDIADANLVLWGDPASNAVLARILDRLPLQWNKMTLAFGTYRLSAAHHVPVFIFPNPLNPRRYIVVNSSFTFRMGSRTSNSLQTPKLPDWALIDLRTPPSDVAPGLIYDAGFFDELWQIPTQP